MSIEKAMKIAGDLKDLKDAHGGESDWSDPLSFSTPKNEFILLFIGFLEHHPLLFPLLRYLLVL